MCAMPPVPQFSFSTSVGACPLVRGPSLSTRPTTLQTQLIECRDGKKKRPKKSSQEASTSPPSTQQPLEASLSTTPSTPAPRVTQHSLITVRQQLKYVQALKEIRTKSTLPPPKTLPYRKPSKTVEELKQEKQEKEAEIALLSKTESKNISLRSLYNTSTRRHPPIVLVDGYNVLHKWDRTKELMGAKETLEQAREELVEALGVYSMRRKVRVCIAFDAMSTGTDSEEILSTGVTVVFSGSCEADSYIEQQAEQWISKGVEKVIAVTDDVAHKAVVDSKKTGERQMCFVIPCSGLLKDMATTEKELKEDIANQSPVMSPMGNLLKARDPEKFKTMQELRLHEVKASLRWGPGGG